MTTQTAPRYTYLLASLILIVLLAPVIPHLNRFFPLFPFLFMTSMLFSLRAVSSKRWLFVGGTVLALAAFSLEFLPGAGFLQKGKELPQLFPLFLYAFFIASSIVVLSRRIFSEQKVNSDTIRGGISVYLLLGIFWALLYLIIEAFSPGAFDVASEDVGRGHLFFYFSFTTLTTLGYGDIVPKNHVAMTLASVEAIMGQIYLAVFVSRLVGLHIAHQLSSKNETEVTQ